MLVSIFECSTLFQPSNNKRVRMQTSVFVDRRRDIISNAQQIRARQYVTSMNIIVCALLHSLSQLFRIDFPKSRNVYTRLPVNSRRPMIMSVASTLLFIIRHSLIERVKDR